jgi:hypothetical protein
MKITAKLLVSTFLLSALLGLFAGSVFANQTTWSGTVGGVNCTATKWIGFGGKVWSTSLTSQSASNINIIGYTYWTIGEYCPGNNTWAFWTQYPGDFRTNAKWYYTAANVEYRGCNGTSSHRSLGNHDFGHGGQNRQPYVPIFINR